MKHQTTSNQAKKPFYKKWWFWAIVVVIAINAIGSTNATDGPDNVVTEVSEEHENIDFDKIKFKPKKLSDDETGKYRVNRISESVNIADYAYDYYNKYFHRNDEVHWIVNTLKHTETRIADTGKLLDVVTTEYDMYGGIRASTLGTGKQLSHIWVDKKTGEVYETMPPEELVTERTKEAAPKFDDIYFDVKPVNNDKTGRWRISAIAESVSIDDYALDYYDTYFKSDDEIHWIVNFTYKTTTVIRSYGVMLDVVTTEYVPREEHDACMLGTGMQLGHVQIDTATDEVTELETFDLIAEMEKTQQIAESLAAQFQNDGTAE